LLEGYQQRELDRVAQTVVTSIAAVERIDSAAPLRRRVTIAASISRSDAK